MERLELRGDSLGSAADLLQPQTSALDGLVVSLDGLNFESLTGVSPRVSEFLAAVANAAEFAGTAAMDAANSTTAIVEEAARTDVSLAIAAESGSRPTLIGV